MAHIFLIIHITMVIMSLARAATALGAKRGRFSESAIASADTLLLVHACGWI